MLDFHQRIGNRNVVTHPLVVDLLCPSSDPLHFDGFFAPIGRALRFFDLIKWFACKFGVLLVWVSWLCFGLLPATLQQSSVVGAVARTAHRCFTGGDAGSCATSTAVESTWFAMGYFTVQVLIYACPPRFRTAAGDRLGSRCRQDPAKQLPRQTIQASEWAKLNCATAIERGFVMVLPVMLLTPRWLELIFGPSSLAVCSALFHLAVVPMYRGWVVWWRHNATAAADVRVVLFALQYVLLVVGVLRIVVSNVDNGGGSFFVAAVWVLEVDTIAMHIAFGGGRLYAGLALAAISCLVWCSYFDQCDLDAAPVGVTDLAVAFGKSRLAGHWNGWLPWQQTAEPGRFPQEFLARYLS